MDIFNTAGDLDFDKANAGIKSAAGMSHGHSARAGDLDVIRTAALVSIADSLRTLAVEAALSMDAAGHLDRAFDPAESSGGPDTLAAVIDAPSGAVVTLYDGRRGRLTGRSGVSEGSAWVELHPIATDGTEYPDETSRVWADQVASIAPPDEPGSLAELAAKVAEVFAERTPTIAELVEGTEPEVEVDLNDHVDDIDADFDGDAHPAADDAVAELKARRKAAKKGKA